MYVLVDVHRAHCTHECMQLKEIYCDCNLIVEQQIQQTKKFGFMRNHDFIQKLLCSPVRIYNLLRATICLCFYYYSSLLAASEYESRILFVCVLHRRFWKLQRLIDWLYFRDFWHLEWYFYTIYVYAAASIMESSEFRWMNDHIFLSFFFSSFYLFREFKSN